MESGDGRELAETLEGVVRGMVEGKDVAVAFSGGLDCSIVASLTGKYANSVRLYTVGVEGAYDMREGESMSQVLGLPWTPVYVSEDDILENVKDMMRVTRTYNPMTLTFEVPLFYVSKTCAERYIIGGQGADELFAGYSKYTELPQPQLRDKMGEDLKRLMTETMTHERAVAEHFGKSIMYPYLHSAVMEIAQSSEIGELTPSAMRKQALRDVARFIGEEEAATKKKKAAQYGSGSVALLRKIAKSRGLTVNGLISELRDSIVSEP